MTSSFRDQISQLLDELESFSAEVDARIRDDSRIQELTQLRGQLYHEAGSEASSEALQQAEQRFAPHQEEINAIYAEHETTGGRLLQLREQVSEVFIAAALYSPEVANQYRGIQRLGLMNPDIRLSRWTSVRKDLGVLIRQVKQTLDFLDRKQSSATAEAPMKPRKLGRPSKISAELKEKALTAKKQRKTNRDCAKILYSTAYPSSQQVKNVPSILRNYKAHLAPKD